MKIYTRTGDKGMTSLRGGARVSKFDSRIEVLGNLDELNSAIGVSLVFFSDGKNTTLKKELTKIQKDIIEISSALASSSRRIVAGLENRITEFEKLIDELTEQMPELKDFILPGGGKEASFLHLARAIARRAERKIVYLFEKEAMDNNVLIYVNRLSDLLFTMARFANIKK